MKPVYPVLTLTDYKHNTKAEGHKLYILSVDLNREHYKRAQWMDYYHYPSSKIVPPLDFLIKTNRINENGDIINLGDREFTKALVTGHPIVYALESLSLPSPAIFDVCYLDPEYKMGTKRDYFVFTKRAFSFIRRWEATMWDKRPSLSPVTIDMLVRERSAYKYGLFNINAEHIRIAPLPKHYRIMEAINMGRDLIKRLKIA